MAKRRVIISVSASRKIEREKQRLIKLKTTKRKLSNKRIDFALALDSLLREK